MCSRGCNSFFFPPGVERETTCCWATNWEVTSVADCTRTILSSSSSVKQDEAAGSYRFHCLLLRLPLSREACGISLFSHARQSLQVIFCFTSLCSSSPDETWEGWSCGPRASAVLRTTTHNMERRTTSRKLPRARVAWSSYTTQSTARCYRSGWRPVVSWRSCGGQRLQWLQEGLETFPLLPQPPMEKTVDADSRGRKTDVCILPKPVHLLGSILPGWIHHTQE